MTGIGDGKSEGLGQIRGEIHKARSPQLVPRADNGLTGSVPLEFDEEDGYVRTWRQLGVTQYFTRWARFGIDCGVGSASVCDHAT